MTVLVIQDTQSTAAGVTTPNCLTGKTYEKMPFDGWVRVLCAAEAAGESRAQFLAGGRQSMDESPVSRQNRMPIEPDDVLVNAFPARRGDQLVLRHRNTGAGANVLFYRLLLRPR